MERPNLKICIENDVDSESDEEKPIIEDFEDDEESEESEDGEIYSSKHSQSGSEEESDSDVGDNKSDNDARSGTEVSADHKLLHEPKRYENKGGEFLTGFDLLLKEYVDMREKRGQRFNITDPPKTVSEDELKLLYESLGLEQEEIDGGERGIRLEAIHIRGVDNMSTKDVFQYFQGFAPGSLEWIDDSSCNVVWMEPVTAARAMIHMSNVREENQIKQDKESMNSRNSTEDKENEKTTSESMEIENAGSTALKPDSKDDDKISLVTGVQPPDTNSKASNMEEDDFDYELNLMSDDEDMKEESKDEKDVQDGPSEKINDCVTNENDEDDKNDGQDAKDEDGTDSHHSKETDNNEKANAMDVDEELQKKSDEQEREISMPPGKWRIGLPFTNKPQILYLRYATRVDIKISGAEKRSHYYRKYGNPNFGGMKGLISGSKKRRILSSKYRKEEEEAKKVISKSKKYSFSDETTFDEHLKAEQERLEKNTRLELRDNTASDEEEYTDDEEEEEDGGRRFDDSADVENELRTLLGESSPPPKKRTMRMYADDVEEEIKKKRSASDYTEGSVYSRLSGSSRHYGDARGRIQGRKTDIDSNPTDLRSRLGRRKTERDDQESFGISYVPSLSIQVEPD